MKTSTIAIKDDNGMVLLEFPQPIRWCELDAETGRQVGEAIAKAAYKARYGVFPPNEFSTLAAEIRHRVTQEIRDGLVTRGTLILKSLQDKGRAPHVIVAELVDQLLSTVT